MTSKDRDCRPYREHDADLVADELVIRFIFVMIRQGLLIIFIFLCRFCPVLVLEWDGWIPISN